MTARHENDLTSSPRIRPIRPGFTLIETIVVVTVVGIVAGIAAPMIGRALAQMRLDRAATVVAADLRLAPSLAARQRQPVQLVVDAANQRYEIRTRSSGAVLVNRLLGAGQEYSVAELEAGATTVTFYPNGLSSDSVRLSLRAGGMTRVIRMTRAGQVRIAP